MTGIVCLALFLSGVAALLFETLWFHQAGLTLGNSVWASGLVLASFMGGLAIGNGLIGRFGHRIRRPVRLYVLLEIVIGVTGLALVHLLPRLTSVLVPWLSPFLDAPGILNPLRFAIGFSVLLIPATAMGATVPVLVGALCRFDPRFGRVLGRLYGWNTLGAVVGAMAGEVVLIRWWGISGTALGAAVFNGVAACVAMALASRVDVEAAPTRDASRPGRLSQRAMTLMAAAFLMGGILLAFEVVWFRFLLLFIDGSSLGFAIMLSVVLAGIGMGGLLGGWWLSREPEAYRVLPAVTCGSAVIAILAYALLEIGIRNLHGATAFHWHEMLTLGLILMFPVSLLSGVLFTLLGEALNREAVDATRAAGLLTLANTTGAALGSLVGSFWLLPVVGIEQSTRLLAGGYAIAAGLLVLGGLRPTGRRAAVALTLSACLMATAVGLFPSGMMERRYLLRHLQRFAVRDGSHPVEIREGLTETAMLLRRDLFHEPLYFRLITNNHSMSATRLRAQRYMKLFVYLPVAVHQDLKRALLISYGVGMTAQALTETRHLEAIDVVDTSQDNLELSHHVFDDAQDDPLDDPRVSVHIEDGRYFLQTTPHRYDLITGEPPPPKSAGIVNLYTREYFALIRNRLVEGGLATYWLPVDGLLEEDTKAILRAFCDVFTDCSLWGGAGLDWILMGTRHAAGPVSVAHFTAQWRDPIVGPELRHLGVERPEQLGALFIAGASDLRMLTQETKPLTDDHPKRLSAQRPSRQRTRGLYEQLMDIEGTQERFQQSELIARLWPVSLREGSLGHFKSQESINGFFLDRSHAAAIDFPRLHQILTETPLRTLPLWLLTSDVQFQRAVRRAKAKGIQHPEIDYHLGARALSDRDYSRAEAHFRAGQEGGAPGREFLHYRLYALCMAGRLEEAAALAGHLEVQGDAQPHDRGVLTFLSETFGLDRSVHVEDADPGGTRTP